LVILLHSYTPNGDWEESFWHIRPLAEARGFLYCHPDSPLDQTGAAFWNATDAGFDFFNTGIDAAGYLRSLIEEISQQFAVDRKRISLIGIRVEPLWRIEWLASSRTSSPASPAGPARPSWIPAAANIPSQ